MLIQTFLSYIWSKFRESYGLRLKGVYWAVGKTKKNWPQFEKAGGELEEVSLVKVVHLANENMHDYGKTLSPLSPSNRQFANYLSYKSSWIP